MAAGPAPISLCFATGREIRAARAPGSQGLTRDLARPIGGGVPTSMEAAEARPGPPMRASGARSRRWRAARLDRPNTIKKIWAKFGRPPGVKMGVVVLAAVAIIAVALPLLLLGGALGLLARVLLGKRRGR